jgi:DNA (cytosine-5)-methyltransferase 1
MSKPRLLDLFCGAGGCTKGYQQAGFHVTGVDINSQPHYCGDEFIQADALTVDLSGYDCYHASPPCQANTVLFPNELHKKDYGHKDCIPENRSRLNITGKPWIIENVPNATMNTLIILCGSMFGLKVYRHRLFESNIMLFQPAHPKHRILTAGKGHSAKDDITFWTVTGHLGNLKGASKAMGIDWMKMPELVQAIPPAYTKFIGEYLLKAIEANK